MNTRDPAEYFIKNIDGEGGIPVRAPIDNAPHDDGGIIHDFWDEPRHITITLVITCDPALTAWEQVQQRNQMYDALEAECYEARRADKTYSRTRSGMSDQSLTTRCDLQPTPHWDTDGLNVTFGIVAAVGVWT
jgi:hypothetical protein